jgi:hypothetical protein
VDVDSGGVSAVPNCLVVRGIVANCLCRSTCVLVCLTSHHGVLQICDAWCWTIQRGFGLFSGKSALVSLEKEALSGTADGGMKSVVYQPWEAAAVVYVQVLHLPVFCGSLLVSLFI